MQRDFHTSGIFVAQGKVCIRNKLLKEPVPAEASMQPVMKIEIQ